MERDPQAALFLQNHRLALASCARAVRLALAALLSLAEPNGG